MESFILPSFMHLLHLQQVILTTESSVKTSTKSILRLTETTLLVTLVVLIPKLDNQTIGLVYATNNQIPYDNNKDPKLSITKEAIVTLLTDTGWGEPGTNPAYSGGQNNSAGENDGTGSLAGTKFTAATGDEETRKIDIRTLNNANNPIPVELRRHSVMRSGNHTFEYLGFGPGNYSTAFPQTQVETLSADQIKFSQSIKEEAGVAFYSGLNSNGDLFIGNQVINPVTGQITNEDIAQLNVVGEENTTIETFSELVLTDKLTGYRWCI